MHKGLNLKVIRNMLPDRFDLPHGQLSGGNHTLRAKLIPETVCLIIGIVCLRTDVSLDLRTYPFCNLKYARICDDQRIRLYLFQLFKVFLHAFQIIIVSENICCHIDLDAMLMGKRNALRHLFH